MMSFTGFIPNEAPSPNRDVALQVGRGSLEQGGPATAAFGHLGQVSRVRPLSHYRDMMTDDPFLDCDTIGNLYNLQTLIILGGHSDILLPAHHGIWKMRQLRHLYIPSGCSPPKSERVKLNELANLQSISLMKVDHWIMGDFSIVTSLRSLGLLGKLWTYQTAMSDFIDRQKNLESLRLIETGNDQLSIPISSSCLHQLDKLHWIGHLKKLPAIHDVALCLTKLVLKRSKLSEDPMAVLEKLPKLQHLKLLNGSPCLQFWKSVGVKNCRIGQSKKEQLLILDV